MSKATPPPPNYLPERPQFSSSSKYQRGRWGISWFGLLIGLALGLAGGLTYAWVIAPVQETETRPAQLRDADKAHYMVAIALSFAYDSDLPLAVDRLAQLELGFDPIQAVADTACRLASSGYVDSNAGLRAVRAMRTFYQLQGRTGCADELIPAPEQVPLQVTVEVPTPTPTLPPPPTKTPPPLDSSPTPDDVVVVPTTPPQRTYDGAVASTFCDVERSGVIEVRVLEADRVTGIPGEPIRVEWDGGESLFYSGLKPERGAGFADFQMEAGGSYLVTMPGLSDPLPQALVADRCFTEGGDEALTSYRVVFARSG